MIANHPLDRLYGGTRQNAKSETPANPHSSLVRVGKQRTGVRIVFQRPCRGAPVVNTDLVVMLSA